VRQLRELDLVEMGASRGHGLGRLPRELAAGSKAREEDVPEAMETATTEAARSSGGRATSRPFAKLVGVYPAFPQAG